MNNDPRNKRNLTADTVALNWNNQTYQLILKDVTPYPGTSNSIPKATLVINNQ
ncbi:hypothetical protein [Adhaeribacter aquaticus]|uniref:hypothetical protein n=1 Tax=Adhaeribacter aquaticus TaxID=299567 RepID=UPI00040249AC|nr:hypothetical protein [Adhaeribacter aquaticus]